MKSGFVICALFMPIICWAGEFVFTAIPDEDETRLVQRFQRVATYLTDRTETEFRYIPVKSYAAAVTAFRNNDVQLAWFGGLSGVRARSLVPNSSAVAQGIEDQAFVTYVIAHHSTGLEAGVNFPTGIKGRTFTFGSKGSTSGRLMPEYYIRQNLNGAPNKVFARVGFSGDHSKTIALVQSGAYEIGAVNFKVWENESLAGNIDAARVSVIWQTPPYPDYQWTIRGDVDDRWGDGFSEKVTQAILSMKDPDLLQSFPRSGFVPAANDDYKPIEDIAREIGLID